MDDFERKKNFGSKEKKKDYRDLHKFRKIFLHILLFLNILCIVCFYLKKTNLFLAEQRAKRSQKWQNPNISGDSREKIQNKIIPKV